MTIILRLIISKGYMKVFSPSLCEEEMKPLLEYCMRSEVNDLKNQIAHTEIEKLY